jgi:hypothetical protein
LSGVRHRDRADQADARAHHRAADVNELHVAAQQQLQLIRRLRGVPPLDGPGDEAGELYSVVLMALAARGY